MSGDDQNKPSDPGLPSEVEGPDFEAARDWCVEYLREDPEAGYAEARRDGKRDAVKITRKVFTAAKRVVFGEEEGHDSDPRQEELAFEEPNAPEDDSPSAEAAPAPERAAPPAGRRPGFRESPEAPAEHSPRIDNPHVARRPDGPGRPPGEPRPPHGAGRPSGHGPRRSPDMPPSRARREDWEKLFGPGPASPSGSPPPSAPSPPSPPVHEPPAPPPREERPVRPSQAPSGPPRPVWSGRLSPVEFMAEILRANPEASYREVKERAEEEGYIVSQAAFGRAQIHAGLIEPIRTPEAAPRVKLPPLTPGGDPVEHLQVFIRAFAERTTQTHDLRQALERMLEVVEAALEELPSSR